MTASVLAKHIASAFQDPGAPSLILLNDSGVTWINQSEPPQLFPIHRNSNGTESVLNSALATVANHVQSHYSSCVVAVGGSFSVSAISGSRAPASLDLALEKSNRNGSSTCAVSALPILPDTILEEAIDSEILALVNRVTSNCGVTVVGICTVAELTLNSVGSYLKATSSMYVSWPNEGILIRRTGAAMEIISDYNTSPEESNQRIGIEQLASKTIPYTELDLSKKAIMRSGAGWANRLTTLRVRKTQYVIERMMPRVTRIAAALIITLGGLGFWQSETLGDSLRRNSQHSQLIQARNDLSAQYQSLKKSAGTMEIIPGLTATSFLGRLGQESVEGVRLTRAQIGATDNASEVSVSGIAENEAQVFLYLETLESHFPGVTISLSNMSMRHVNSRNTQSTTTSFELRFTR